MEKAVKEGKVRSIGISNFESERLEELCEAAAIKPAVLQVECHLALFVGIAYYADKIMLRKK